jgi:hypothetical protein
MKRGPDFIIIGAMKCATSTLHEQLAAQPGIFMSTPKEPCYFSDDEIYERGQGWYTSLFAEAPPHALCGESSTHYTKLPTYRDTIARMRHLLSDRVRFIYVMRHPIDRLVSQYIHEWTQRVISKDINEAVNEHPELIDYSRYAMQLEPYLQTFGRERVLPLFFDRLTVAPQAELQRVCEFIGYQGNAVWHDELSEQNVSSERMRRSPARDLLINLPGLKQARRALVPKSMRERIKSLWMMKRRPELSEQNVTKLRAIFDEDLAKLSEWLDVGITCENFKRVTREKAPRWAQRTEVAAA